MENIFHRTEIETKNNILFFCIIFDFQNKKKNLNKNWNVFEF